jgi:3-carboxy-cis,cis-muconate cycloisomerase
MKMNNSIYDSFFSTKEMNLIFSDEEFINKILYVELMLSKANYKLNIIPYKAFKDIKKVISSFTININSIKKNIEMSGVPTLEIIKTLEYNLESSSKQYLHYGATSQDIIDTAVMLQIKDSKSILLNHIKKLSENIYLLLNDNKETLMVGRTRNMQATVTTFGLKAAYWLLPLLRYKDKLDYIFNNGLPEVQLGGPVGNLALYKNSGLEVKKKLAELLDLNNSLVPWHTQRENLADFSGVLSLITGSLGKIGKDILALSKSEINELELFNGGKSSVMPHKNNPIKAELLITLANLNANHLSVMHNAIIHENERDGISWLMEWQTLSKMIKICIASLHQANLCFNSLKINKDIMKKNLELTNGLAMSDYYFDLLLKFYPYDILTKKFSKIITKVKSNNSHLAIVIIEELGSHVLRNKDIDFNKHLGSNHKLINLVRKEYKKHY